MLTRRQFASSLAALGAAALSNALPSYAEEPAAKPAAQPAKKASKYIDVHTHIGTYTHGNKELTVPALLEWMDAHDVEKAVILPLISPESTTYIQLPELALKAAQDHPARFIPFCSLDPRSILSNGKRGVIDILQRYIDLGAKGFGEHKVGLDFDDPLMMRIYEGCQEVKLPLLFHMDNIRGKDKAGLPRLEAALRAFPELTFIGHGPGWWGSISGDFMDFGAYPSGKVAPGGAMDRLMETYPNIFSDLSAGSGANAIGRDKEFGREFLLRRQDRVLFGTDYLQPGQGVPQFELLESLNLPEEAARKIYRGNAERVLKLKG